MPLALVTGAAHAGQVGEAVAERLAADGFDVVLLDRNADEAARRAEAHRRHGGRVEAHGVDLADPAALAAVADRVRAAAPDGLAALVHAAGGFAAAGPVADADVAVLHRMVAVNLTTAYCATRAFLPQLRRGRGAVVYFASPAALPGATGAGMAAYAAAKAGVLALMRAVAAEEGTHGVRANAVAPEAVRTAANVRAMGEDAAYVERETVAAAVRWLCGDEARSVTGQVLRLAP